LQVRLLDDSLSGRLQEATEHGPVVHLGAHTYRIAGRARQPERRRGRN
jgi:hypothetical protein